MNTKKHIKTNKSNHLKSKKRKKINLNKLIFTIILILLVVFGITKIRHSSKTNETPSSSSSSLVKEISTSKTIEGLDNIEVTGIIINKKDDTSYIEMKLKNNSNTSQSAFKTHISILDKDNHILFGIQCSVSGISANSEISCNIISNDDLTNADSYEINKIN